MATVAPMWVAPAGDEPAEGEVIPRVVIRVSPLPPIQGRLSILMWALSTNDRSHPRPVQMSRNGAMRKTASAFIAIALAVLAASCTGSDFSCTGPCESSAPTPVISPAKTFVILKVGEQHLNVKRGIYEPGDVVSCAGRKIHIPPRGKHVGESGGLWAVTSTTGSVSIGCKTNVVFGTLT